MQKGTKYRAAIFFTILFMAIISAPTIITSIDKSVDISCFFGIGEEEEESENLKLVIENDIELSEDLFVIKTRGSILGYSFKTYPKPHLNLISPPPDFIS
jgi:hypothetical protein